MKREITEEMIVAYLQAAGGYEAYQRALKGVQTLRDAAIDMLEEFDGDIDQAVRFTKEGQQKIFDAVGIVRGENRSDPNVEE